MTTATETNATIPDGAGVRTDGKLPTMGWNENHFYKVKVTRQLMAIDKKGVNYVSIYGRVLGMLSDTRNPNSGLLAAPDAEVEVRLRFDSERPDTMEFSIKDLANMGFTDTDLSKLDPDHPQHVSFIGREVFVAPKYRAAGDYVNCYWNFRFPRDLSAAKSVGSAAVKSSAAADVFAAVMARVKKDTDSLPADDAPAKTKKKVKADAPYG